MVNAFFVELIIAWLKTAGSWSCDEQRKVRISMNGEEKESMRPTFGREKVSQTPAKSVRHQIRISVFWDYLNIWEQSDLCEEWNCQSGVSMDHIVGNIIVVSKFRSENRKGIETNLLKCWKSCPKVCKRQIKQDKHLSVLQTDLFVSIIRIM